MASKFTKYDLEHITDYPFECISKPFDFQATAGRMSAIVKRSAQYSMHTG